MVLAGSSIEREEKGRERERRSGEREAPPRDWRQARTDAS